MTASGEDFARFYERQQTELVRLAVLICGDIELAQEAVAAAVARSWEKWAAGRVADLDGYVRRAVVNQLIGRFRRAAVERRWRQQPEARPVSVDEEHLVVEERMMRQAIAGLPAAQRAVVVLRYYLDLSERDIANATGTKVGTVKSRLSRALEHLRLRLTDGDPDV